mmetsp:Transcript_8841/g.14434  ORF Transcript_8841/g.14434 Transcript_8841/m.14434 type:complete len:83 (+) Transcript_8841:234-482(+)
MDSYLIQSTSTPIDGSLDELSSWGFVSIVSFSMLMLYILFQQSATNFHTECFAHSKNGPQTMHIRCPQPLTPHGDTAEEQLT